ncbi:four helix bundle protein [candidate division WOR-3 bacterium]|jgi:four helix bundle protein|nr:four helix bundle protein [candidate division WOR-3 bacterium]
MANIKRFEDIKAWQKSRELVKEIYYITNNKKFMKDWSLKEQVRRAAVSIISNIAEGFSRQTDKEFIQFLYIAKGSASEIQSHLYLSLDLGYLSKEEFKKVYIETEEISKMISGFIRYLKDSKNV